MISSLIFISYALSALASPVMLHDGGAGNGTLSENILVLSKHGPFEIIKQNDWLASLEAAGVLLEKPAVDEPYLNATDVPLGPLGPFPTNETLGKRQASCDSTYAITTDTAQRFVDWDVQMSPVVCAVGDMDINVMKGYMVANSVTFGVSFSRTWTTQDSITTKGTVKDGNCSVMITRPLVTRRYGRTMQGCPRSYKQIGTWMADEHGEGSYAGIDWVSGAIFMCTKKQAAPPLTRCQGAGEFV
ncbi:hypothetical protein KCU83_g1349, partial [Aureobasidium melanogenum]